MSFLQNRIDFGRKEGEDDGEEENGYTTLVVKSRDGGRVVKRFGCCKKRIDAKYHTACMHSVNGTKRNEMELAVAVGSVRLGSFAIQM